MPHLGEYNPWLLYPLHRLVQYFFTNIRDEVATRTNPNNAIQFSVLSQPTVDPPTLAALNAFTSEILPGPGLTAGFVAGYFGARCVGAENVWALNSLIDLEAGSTGNATGIQVDVDNDQAADKGVGIRLDGIGAHDPYAAILVERTAGLWNRGIIVNDFDDYGLMVDSIAKNDAVGIRVNVLTGVGSPNVIQTSLNANGAFSVAHDPVIFMRKRTPEGAEAPGEVLHYWVHNDANERIRIGHDDIEFGAGGASALDTRLYRSLANQLRTPDQIVCDDGVVVKVKTGAHGDGDYTVDTNGLIGVDDTGAAEKLYFRAGGAWFFINKSGGLTFPENTCSVCGGLLEVDDVIVHKVDKKLPDGQTHAVPIHLKCAHTKDPVQ